MTGKVRANRRFITGSLAVLALVGAVFYAQVKLNNKNSSSVLPSHKSSGVPDMTQTEHFDLFHTDPESVPASITRLVRRNPPRFGLNWRLAQRLPIRLRDPYWIVPGERTLCLTTREETGEVRLSCQPTFEALKHGVATVSIQGVSRPGKGIGVRHIVGLAPNRARYIVIRTGERREVVAVRRHVFVVSDSASLPPTDMTVRSGNGPERY